MSNYKESESLVKHWDSKVEVLEALNLGVLQTIINEFCKNKFVVGIQYPDSFQNRSYIAIVSYKVQQK